MLQFAHLRKNFNIFFWFCTIFYALKILKMFPLAGNLLGIHTTDPNGRLSLEESENPKIRRGGNGEAEKLALHTS